MKIRHNCVIYTADDEDERPRWDKRVRYWAYLDDTLETLNKACGG